MEKFYVGVDVGGTSIKMGMFSHTGELLEKWEIPTRVDEDEQTDRILPDIAVSIEEKRAEKNGNIVGIGLGIPGPVTDDGTVLKCANIHWPVFNVKEKLFDLTGVANIRVGNDANVAALGEMWKGGGRGFDSIVMVTLGTGVGGGVILGGKILTGTKGAAGEIGHMTKKRPATAVRKAALNSMHPRRESFVWRKNRWWKRQLWQKLTILQRKTYLMKQKPEMLMPFIS